VYITASVDVAENGTLAVVEILCMDIDAREQQQY
jgi:hypothetical protein